MKRFHMLSLWAVFLFVASSAFSDTPAPTPAPEPAGAAESEVAPVVASDPSATPAPIVIKWDLKKLDGWAELVVSSDGSYLFSGKIDDKEAEKEISIVLGLKSNLGVVTFDYAGGAEHGAQWSKMGHSDFLKTNFSAFAGKISWTGAWRLSLTKEGKAKLFEEREMKREKLEKERREAERKMEQKVIDEVDKKIDAFEKQTLTEERAQAQSDAQPAPAGGGGGGGGGGVMGDIMGALGSAVPSLLAAL